METVPLEILRTAFAQSVIATMATQVSCYMRLASHPDVLIIDLLDALGRNAVVADDAASRLYRRFSVDDKTLEPVAQRAYWDRVLAARGIEAYSPLYLPAAASAEKQSGT